ncbi:MAG TPA: aminotransferase class I/II-fold pyridoxal phosphate-dependent enzyme [Polyangiaceae bacterium]
MTFSSTEHATSKPAPREDDDLIAELLQHARNAVTRSAGLSADAAAVDTVLHRDLRRHCHAMASTVSEVSDSFRNWATHVPWDQVAALRDDAVPAEERAPADWRFSQHELPAIIRTLEELAAPSYLEEEVNEVEGFALDKNAYDFYRPAGANLIRRTDDYYAWVEARRNTELWQYSRTLEASPSNVSALRNDLGRLAKGINYNSQDYLSLNTHPAVRAAVHEALLEFGPHSAGSPMVLGNTHYSNSLEEALAELTRMEHVMLFPTGWAAGFGSIVGLVRQDDHVVLDRLAHACLQQGARAATRNLSRYEHLNIEAAREAVREIRARDAHNGILVVTDGLFSVDSDYCDLEKLQEYCREYDATLLVDTAHDLGSMGPGGTGILGMQGMLGKVDLVMSSFSKVFASNGGFLASRSPSVKQYVKMFSGTHLFSNALSAPQAAAVLQATRIVRSPEGDTLRGKLFAAIHGLRDELTRLGLTCMGEPSPIVPLLIGNEKLARVAHRLVFERNVLAFMVEFPIAPTGASRFRLQVQASHTPEQGQEAARVFAEVITEARSYLSSAFGMGLS